MKKLISNSLLLIALSTTVYGQYLTVETCQQKARENYPLLKQYGLIEKTTAYNLANAAKANLPQVNFTARATYQSAVTKLPITLAGVVIPELTKDQFQATLDVSQVLWDGGVVKAQKKGLKATAETEKNKLDVDLYALNDRVNQLFFGILMLNEQIVQLSILQNELEVNFKRLVSLKQNGVANQTDLDAIKVEQIDALQRETDVQCTRKSFTEMLTALTGISIIKETVFQKPSMQLNVDFNAENKRPELTMLDAQQNLIESQRDIIVAANMPKVGFFVQGGYGKPGLNMLTNAFSPFYIGGLRLTWSLSGFYTQKNNFDKIELSKKSVEIQKETFLFNNTLHTTQQLNEINKLKLNLKNDDEIIRLRINIKKSCETKVENGTATITDLLREINAENIAKQSKLLHEIQLYMVFYQYKNNVNN